MAEQRSFTLKHPYGDRVYTEIDDHTVVETDYYHPDEPSHTAYYIFSENNRSVLRRPCNAEGSVSEAWNGSNIHVPDHGGYRNLVLDRGEKMYDLVREYKTRMNWR